MPLPEAIEGLYGVFSNYALADHVEGCTHCVFDRDHALIHSAPLRQLSARALERYTEKAMSTWGNSDDFRHFLPRIFELQARNTWEPTFVEIAFGKLTYAGWRSWPDIEREAVRQYFLSLWVNVLDCRDFDGDETKSEAESYLSGFSCAGEPLGPYLSVWQQGDLRFRREHFAATIDWFSESLQESGRLAGGFWEVQPSMELRAWLNSKEVQHELLADRNGQG